MNSPVLQSSVRLATALNTQTDNESLLYTLGSGLYMVFPPLFIQQGWAPWYYMLREWSSKPFPNTTLMFIGSGVSIRPLVPVIFYLVSLAQPAPHTVQVYSDGTSYASLFGISIPILYPKFTLYLFSYQQKGFHHLRFVPDGNESAAVIMDIQVGFQGFVQHILPYLRE